MESGSHIFVEIFADGRDFRRRPSFSLATEIFASDQDFRRRPRFSPTAEIFADAGRSSNSRNYSIAKVMFRQRFFSDWRIWLLEPPGSGGLRPPVKFTNSPFTKSTRNWYTWRPRLRPRPRLGRRRRRHASAAASKWF